MSTQLTQQQPRVSALAKMAERYSVDATKLLDTLKGTVFKNATNEQLLSLVVVANEYGLNPFTKQIYAFPEKGGGITPVVGVDGWIALINRQESFDGCEFVFADDSNGKPHSCTCRIHVKGRSRAVEITEYFDECVRNTEPWNKSPRRMLRHKALIQAGRVAFGLCGIVDEDDARDIIGHVQLPEPSIEVKAEVQQSATPATKPTTPNKVDPRAELAVIVTDAGFTFDDLMAWAAKEGQLEDASAFAEFSQLQADWAARMVRAAKGMIAGIKQMKEVAK